MTIDDVLTRALGAEADEVSVPDDAWERLMERLAREPAAAESPPTPPRHWVLVAAAVLVVVAAVAAAVTLSGDDPLKTGPQEGGAPEPSTTTVDAAPSPGVAPATAVAVTEDGDLVQIDRTTGAVTMLTTTPASSDEGGEYIFGHIDRAAVGRDGTVLFSTCCDPGPGETFRLDPGGGRTSLAYGYNPVFSPGGTSFALVDPTGLTVHGLDGDQSRAIGDDGRQIMAVSWSPRGDWFAVEVLDASNGGDDGTRAVVLVPVTADSLAEAVAVTPPAGAWWSDPVFRADGSLLVIEHGPTAGNTALRRVGADGQPGDPVDLQGLRPERIAADRTGGWVIVAPVGTGPSLILDRTNTASPVPNPLAEPLADVAW